MTGMKPTLRELTAAHFEPHAGGTFIFQAPEDANGNPGPETAMELLEVSLGRKVPAARQPFSLLFRRTAGPELAPVLHLIVHEAFEQEWMYLSRIAPPLDRDPAESYYEAAFN